MTKEEIRQAAQKEFAYQVEIGSKAPFEVREGFIKGAEWMQERMQDTNEGQALLYAVEKTAERTKREMIEKAAEWLSNNMFHSINNGVQINGTCVSDFIERLKQAMQDECK